MVAFAPFANAVVVAAAVLLILAPLPGAPCAPCGPMDEAAGCCPPAQGPAGASQGCPGDELDATQWAPVAADLGASAPVQDLVTGLAGAPVGSRLPDSRGGASASSAPHPTPQLYLLLTVFLI